MLGFSSESLCEGEDMMPNSNGTNVIWDLLGMDEVLETWPCDGSPFRFYSDSFLSKNSLRLQFPVRVRLGTLSFVIITELVGLSALDWA